MIQPSKESWVSCPAPVASDTIRWREPLWDKPTKPRGKPDKIGVQLVTAKVIVAADLVELQVIGVKHQALKKDAENMPITIKKGDMIRRKMSSLKMGECQKLLQEV